MVALQRSAPQFHLHADNCLHGYFGAGYRNGVRRQVDRLEDAKLALGRQLVPATAVTRDPAPFASISGQALWRPACLLAVVTFRGLRQVALSPVVLVLDRVQVLARHVRRVFLAIGHGKVLALDMGKVLAYWKECRIRLIISRLTFS